jgi:hypothetical protein
LLLGIAAVLAASAGAVAQFEQPVTATVDETSVDRPDELPGTLRADLRVTVKPAADDCTCTETTVTMTGTGDAASFSFEPSSYTIDWSEQDGGHEQTVTAQLAVDEVDEQTRAEIGVEMTHEPEDQHITSEVEPARIPLGNGSEAVEGQAAESKGEPSGVPGPGAGLAAVAAIGAALRRRA